MIFLKVEDKYTKRNENLEIAEKELLRSTKTPVSGHEKKQLTGV